MIRWTFATLTGSESDVFEVSPNAQDSPLSSRAMTWDFHPQLGWSGHREPRAPTPWTFSGVLHSQAQYDALLTWVSKKVKIVITDDRSERLVVRLLKFEPTQEAGQRNAWRMTYTMRALIFEPRFVELSATGPFLSSATARATMGQTLFAQSVGTSGGAGTGLVNTVYIASSAPGAATAEGSLIS